MSGYGEPMIESSASSFSMESVEDVLCSELANGDAVSGTIAPILRHLLANSDQSFFSDEIIARTRGMLGDIAGQLLDRLCEIDGEAERNSHDANETAALIECFAANEPLLGHFHALAVEWQLTERLHAKLGLDPILSPLIQSLVASRDAETSSVAMRLLASQARFGQAQRRMNLAINELPGKHLDIVLGCMRTLAQSDSVADERAAAAEAAIRADYWESESRLGLLNELINRMGGDAMAALSISHGGVPLFVTALAIGSGQDRDTVVLSTNEAQLARLALALRSAGLKPAVVEEQFLALHPQISLPDGFDLLRADSAAAILARTSADTGEP